MAYGYIIKIQAKKGAGTEPIYYEYSFGLKRIIHTEETRYRNDV